VGCAALREPRRTRGLVDAHGPQRGRGVGTALLRQVLDEARARGYRRVSLETGTHAFFTPAHQLYAAHGFLPCAPFGTYVEDPHSRFFTLDLSDASAAGNTSNASSP
jgi:putative acetyltransferase